jgi:SpoIID/LytB domain protein
MAYKGRAQETAAASLACEETFGVVLLSGGDVLDAVYHEVCGGTTAGADEVWDSPPIAGLVPVWDSDKDGGSPDLADEKQVAAFLFGPFAEGYCSPTGASYPKYARKYFRWTKTMSADELRSACGVSSVRSLEVIDRRKSGRVRKLRVTGDSGEKIFEKELPIRNTFGLYSGLFVMKPEIRGGHVASVQFAGAGHGHGVGLCQMGAWTMATRGQTWEQILAHYYRGARIEQIYRK